jgi:hypothetical protein
MGLFSGENQILWSLPSVKGTTIHHCLRNSYGWINDKYSQDIQLNVQYT